MPETILGLDIGADAVKAIMAVPRGRMDARILACETVPLEDADHLGEALQKIADSIRPEATSRIHCVVSLPPSDAMFRNIRLPFRDDARIRKTLYFELEPLLPLPVEEVVADYLPLAEGGLLAAAVIRDRVRNVIDSVEACLGPVSVVDIAPAVLALPLLEQKALTGSGMVLDVGASESCAMFYEQNALVQIRSFAFGGKVITEALAADWSCSLEEAEIIKTGAGYGQRKEAALAACRSFCASLSNTVEFLCLNEILHALPGRILITGGGSLFKELGDELARTFGAPVELLDGIRTGELQIDEKLKSRFAPPRWQTALALIKRAHTARKSFNFRQGDLAVKTIRGDLRRHLRLGAVLASILLVLAAADLFFGYRVQTRQADDLKKEISLIFKKHFSASAVMVDPVMQLKTKLAEDKKTYGMADGVSGAGALELLNELSGQIPPALDVVITHWHFENHVMLLTGEAKKIDDVTNVKNELQKSKTFKNVTIGKTALNRDGASVNFDLRIELP